MKLSFCDVLKLKNRDLLKNYFKVDIHNHASYSCKTDFLMNNGIQLERGSINSIETLNNYCRNYINPIQYDYEGLSLLLKGNFENCIKTGVLIVAPSIDYKVCIRIFNNNIEMFLEFLKKFEYENLKIAWDLGISRDSYKQEYSKLILKLIQTKYFSGIDLYATESSIPNSEFVEFYKLANELELVTKVHAGEQLGANYIKECIEDFNPKQIQHGIKIVEDKHVMKLAKDRGIIFNVCPTSNVILGYAKSYIEHPIRKMIDFGLKVTIGTDDLLFFNSDINEEYIRLYEAGTLTAEELDKIRKFGLRLFK